MLKMTRPPQKKNNNKKIGKHSNFEKSQFF